MSKSHIVDKIIKKRKLSYMLCNEKGGNIKGASENEAPFYV